MITRKNIVVATTLLVFWVLAYLKTHVMPGLWPKVLLSFVLAGIIAILVEYLHSSRFRITLTNLIFLVAMGVIMSDVQIESLYGPIHDYLHYLGLSLLAVWAVVESVVRKRQSYRVENR